MQPNNHQPASGLPQPQKKRTNKLTQKRPKARLKIGGVYNGKKTSFIAQGVVVFREWDERDKQFYYWEEWELTGFNDYDSWIEYDHYTKKVTVYEPVDIVEKFQAAGLRIGQKINVTIDRELVSGTVYEVGVADVEYLKGKMSYQLFADDRFSYAAVMTPRGTLSIEDYRVNNKNEKDYYVGRVLSKKQQKAMFGKSLHPFNWQGALKTGIFTIFFIFLFAPEFAWLIPRYETVCTPRTATPATSSSVASSQTLQDNQQTCSKRRVFFRGHSGGRGGVGK